MIEQLTILVETPARGTTPASFADGTAIGALPLDAEASESSLGGAAFTAETEAVRIERTPYTAAHAVPGAHVTWRGERWRIQRRAESRHRANYDLALERAT